MDLVDDILRFSPLRSSINYRVANGRQFGLGFLPCFGITLHCVLSGQCWVGLEASGTTLRLHAGDVLMVKTAERIWFSDQQQPPDHLPCNQDQLLIADCPPGMTPGPVLIGGSLCSIDQRALHPLYATLPDHLLISASQLRDCGYQPHAGFTLDETVSTQGLQHSPIVDRLFEILLLQIINTYLAGRYHGVFLHALNQPALAKVIMAIHEKPAHNWSLERLAVLSGMSRSAFSKLFSERVGMSAMRYLTLWRMHRALTLLQAGENTDDVAQQVGYLSAPAFHKAFKRVHGFTPAQSMSHN